MLMHFLYVFWDFLVISSEWIVISLILSGIIHAFVRPQALQKSIGNKKLSSLIKTTISGALLPICSCGVLPLALSLYRTGAYLGPTLSFLVATPIINPAAIIVAFAMLGKEITIIYILCGIFLPLIIGMLGNIFGGKELISPEVLKLQSMNIKIPENTYVDKTPWYKKLFNGILWGFNNLGIEISRFILLGTLFGAILITVIPQSFVMQYLSNPKLVSIIGITAVGCIMYVCALGHIPFIAALISAGTSPGIAITFLITGVATNISELISIYKLIGKRTLIIYLISMLFFGILIGYITNILLTDSFTPIFDLSNSKKQIEIANNLNIAFPDWFRNICAVVVLFMGLYSWFMVIVKKIQLLLNKSSKEKEIQC
ncbi:efflux transporter SaoE [uncultured Brachyspira sp.]|uniref:efflux transporter SaoE n=1 Tax=uncultured Brachyspira sp. TaxID=221953 RepID=UPI002623D692|nr:efflux transporter SaoE [uncultured Brachyspira sp.]